VDYLEAEYLNKATSGDASAFAQLYDEYVRKIYRYVYYRTHHQETAEDLTSLIFMKAFEEIRSFKKQKGTFSAWLYRIARNTVIDHYRSVRTTSPLEDVWDALRDKQDVPRDLDLQTKLAEVEVALASLPSAQREILLLRLWDGYSYAEIAQMTNKSEAACKMGASRALKALRNSLPLALFLSLLISPHV
jgi:RNA polymerase sigma-70 factor (ECF subfamily)